MNRAREEKLDFWITHNKNVLLVGNHGVGKTSIVKHAFEKHNLKWLYFSASTMDPWCDFIGVPRESQNKLPEGMQIVKSLAEFDIELAVDWIKNNWKMEEVAARKIINHVQRKAEEPVYLDLVRPRHFANDEIEVLFFDELNRSPKKVRNAVMELIQFKSINGKKFNNLRMVWAAINPESEDGLTYDVEKLDDALEDRFHIKTAIPDHPDGIYFKNKFGEQYAKIAIDWWKDLPKDFQQKVSPRRLDYALEIKKEGGDFRDALPENSNVGKLGNALNTGHMPDKLEALIKNGDVAAARIFLANDNNYAAASKYILESETLMNFFLPLIPKEKISVLMSDKPDAANFIINNSDKIPIFRDICKQIITANQNQRLVKQIRRAITERQELANAYANNGTVTPDKAFFVSKTKDRYSAVIRSVQNSGNFSTVSGRNAIYAVIEKSIPEVLTADEGLVTLEMLAKIVENAWASTMTSEPMANLIGIVNHCIAEIARNTGYDFEKILKNHGNRFKVLLDKLREFGMINRLYCP